MKRNTLALLLCAVLLLTACAAPPPETTAPPTAPTYPQDTSVEGTSIRIGNYSAEIPDSFSVHSSDDQSIVLASPELKCVIGLYASDASSISEESLKSWIAQQIPSSYGAEKTETLFSDLKLNGYLWVELDENLKSTACIQTTFTDSWYIYRVETHLLPDAPDSEAMGASIRFLSSFTSNDAPPRFEWHQ